MKYDVVVIGAGASGMMAAVQAAKAENKGVRGRSVALLEVLARPGKKLLVTGNGKCNLTNYKLDGSCYHTDSGSTEDIMSVIDGFNSEAVTQFFRGEGMLVRERDGYVYPYSEQASSVLDCMRQCLVKYGVRLICGCEIDSVKKNGDGFSILGNVRDVEEENKRADAKKNGGKKAAGNGRKAGDNSSGNKNIAANGNGCAFTGRFSFDCEKLIVATGSAAGGVCNQGMAGRNSGEDNCALGYNIAGQFGHHIVKPLPALVALTCEESFFKEISGVRAKGSVKLFVDGKCIASDAGEIQLTDNGISGIPVFQVSRHAVGALERGRKVRAELDLMPEYGEDELAAYIDKIKANAQRIDYNSNYLSRTKVPNLGDILTGLVNKKLMTLFVKMSGGRTDKLVELLKHFNVNVVNSKGVAAAQVCSGGVRLVEVNIDTMESKLCPGLYFCGEVLDVDGCCGGYNLQWAWSSGFAAGKNI